MQKLKQNSKRVLNYCFLKDKTAIERKNVIQFVFSYSAITFCTWMLICRYFLRFCVFSPVCAFRIIIFCIAESFRNPAITFQILGCEPEKNDCIPKCQPSTALVVLAIPLAAAYFDSKKRWKHNISTGKGVFDVKILKIS